MKLSLNHLNPARSLAACAAAVFIIIAVASVAIWTAVAQLLWLCEALGWRL